jgi:hypothetical protein
VLRASCNITRPPILLLTTTQLPRLARTLDDLGRTISTISRGQTRSRSRSGSSCYADVAAMSEQLPLPPLVGSDEIGSPSSVCHFGLQSRDPWCLSGEPRVDPRHPQYQSVPGRRRYTPDSSQHEKGHSARLRKVWLSFGNSRSLCVQKVFRRLQRVFRS